MFTNEKKLREKLVEELGRRVVWTVYVEADRDSLWQDTVFVMDTIRGLGADVCWITPKTREEWSEQRPLRTPEGTIPIGSRQTYGAPTEKLQVRAR